MANYRIRKKNEKRLRFATYVGSTMSLMVGSIVQLERNALSNWPTLIRELFIVVKDWAPFLILSAIILMVLPAIVKRYTTPVIILRSIEKKLDVFRDWVCVDSEDDYNDNHRVTVFQYKKSYWGILFNRRNWTYERFPWSLERTPRSGWLVPVVRSGHSSKRAKTVFWAPDDGPNCEGFAGKAWGKDCMVTRDSLPCIKSTSSDQQKNKYCRDTETPNHLIKKYIESDKSPARSFAAFPIKVMGENWGVVVIDSQSANGIDFNQIQKAMTTLTPVLSILLEEL